ncbi:MAG TPA: anaerobic ribonucleoside-triphosphate reductase activating protein [Casimicrobiaceae bacterium]
MRHGHALSAPARRATRAEALRIGGLTALSTTDYPGHLAAVVFCQGCPWRCGYCHNPHLLAAHGAAGIGWDHVAAFLGRRAGLLDAVVFSGGEPLAQAALAAALRAVRRMGFRVALHTGGAYPQRLAQVLPLVDWIGFDVKAAFADYARITATPGSGDRALASAKLVIASGVEHEFRTTVHPRQHAPEALALLADRLAALGVRRYVLQEFRAAGCADAGLRADVPPSFITDAWCARVAPAFESFAVRRG